MESSRLSAIDRSREVTLLDILDGILDKGVVIGGDLTISVANIDLVYVELRILVTAVERMLGERMSEENLGHSEAHRTEAYRTEAYRTEAYRTEAYRTEAYRTEAYRTEAQRNE